MEKVEKSAEEQNLENILSTEESAPLASPEIVEKIQESPNTYQQKIDEKLEEIKNLPKTQEIGINLSSTKENSFALYSEKQNLDVLDTIKKWGKKFLVTAAFGASSITGFAKGSENGDEEKSKKTVTENVSNARKIASTELSPEYISIGKSGQKEFFKKTNTVRLEVAKPGKSNEDPKKYENWVKAQLANGVTPQELAEKKYISNQEIAQYTEFYKPTTDIVYIESDRGTLIPTPVTPNEIKQPTIEIKKVPPAKQEINKSYIVNVRGDERGNAGAFYVARDENHLREIQSILNGGFSNAEYRSTHGQITVNMSNSVLLNNWVNTPEKRALLGKLWHRDPQNPDYIVQDQDSTVEKN